MFLQVYFFIQIEKQLPQLIWNLIKNDVSRNLRMFNVELYTF